MFDQKSLIASSSSDEARQVRRIWENFLKRAESGLDQLRPVVRASWLRSRERGVDPNRKVAPTVLSQEQVRDLCEKGALSKAAAPILRLLCEALEGSRFLLVLADSQCRMLEIVGHHKALDLAQKINGVIGSQWLEDQVGTDSLALSALLNIPAQTHWSEHYCEMTQETTGSTAPIHSPLTKETVGFLNLWEFGEIAHPRALEMAVDSAAMIEQRLYEEELNRRLLLFERYNAHQSKFPHELILCMDARGIIQIASPSAGNLLGLAPEEVNCRSFPQLFGLPSPETFFTLVSSSSPYTTHLDTKTGHTLKATLTLVKKEHDPVGFLAILHAKSVSVKKAQAVPSWRASYTFADIIGQSKNFLACIASARQMAQTDLPVLISGESGTGKELFAHAIHNASGRREGPFVALNCGGMSEELLGAELFGYAEGAFTGAARGGRTGKLELAHGGTLLLDEVEEMSPRMQAHLLRVFEDRRVVPLGAEKPCAINLRVIAATNSDLEARIREGKFRQDLYYRLGVLTLSLPPLRERRKDISLLVKHILGSQRNAREISAEALERLEEYHWPGNVRQLRSALLQAMNSAAGILITEADLPSFIVSAARSPILHPSPQKEDETLEKIETAVQKSEREAILRALKGCGGNISRAASQLGLHRTTLYRKMERQGIKAEHIWH